jgi:acyl carrier protein
LAGTCPDSGLAETPPAPPIKRRWFVDVLKLTVIVEKSFQPVNLLNAWHLFLARIIFLNELPKGPTGKLQRIGLAEKLADFMTVEYEAPSTEMEKLVASTMAQILGVKALGRNDNFFSLGGNSLRATQALASLQQELGLSLPISTIFRNPTPALLAGLLDLMLQPEIDNLATALEKLTPEERTRLFDDLNSTGA